MFTSENRRLNSYTACKEVSYPEVSYPGRSIGMCINEFLYQRLFISAGKKALLRFCDNTILDTIVLKLMF